MRRSSVSNLVLIVILVVIGVFLAVRVSHCQTSTVTAIISDSDGQAWNNGTWSAQLYNPSSTQQPVYTATGQPVPTFIQNQTLDATGTMLASIPDNNLITPLGTRWNFTLCSDTSAPCSVTTNPVMITGISTNITTQLTSQLIAPRFQVGHSFMRGYLDLEVTNYVKGSTYYNVTSQRTRLYNGSSWVDLAGPGTSAPGGNNKEIQFNNSGTFAGSTGVTYDSANGIAMPGNVASGTVSSSVNSAINPRAQPYNATGNGTSDDTAAFQAACDAARLSNPPKTLYIPYGNYLVDDLNFHCMGVSMDAPKSGMALGSGTYSTTLIGKPGKDILHTPDPHVYVGTAPNRSWSIENITFTVDSSIDPNNRAVTDGVTNGTTTVTSATMNFQPTDVGKYLTIIFADYTRNVLPIATYVNATTVTVTQIPNETHTGVSFYIPLASPTFPHRWPGRWVQDVSTTTGSSIYTSTRANFTCGDVSQWIRIVGAGTGGTDIVTLIPQQTWCTVQQTNGPFADSSTVDLGAANQAAATLTNAYGYVSVDNVGPYTLIGNCAMAFDDFDGNNTNYTMTGTKSNNYPILKNVVMNSITSIQRNSSCGFYTSGTWSPYGIHTLHTNIQRLDYGVVEATQDTNLANSAHTGYGTFGNDYQEWNHMFINTNVPWVSYNGCCNTLTGLELTAGTGIAVLSAGSGFETSAFNWNINVPELEKDVNVGTHIAGSTMNMVNVGLGSYSSIDGTDITCKLCVSQTPTGGQATLEVSGLQNDIQLQNQIDHVTVTTNSPSSRVTGLTQASSINGFRPIMLSNTRTDMSLEKRADFVRTNPLTPFNNAGDLYIWPHDIICHATTAPVVADAASISGYYVVSSVANGCGEDFWLPLKPLLGGHPVIGGTTPVLGASKYQWIASIKCPTITSFALSYWIKSYPSGTNVAGPISVGTQACSTGYTTIRNTVDLTTYGGGVNYLWPAWPLGEIDIAWEAWRPFADDFSGSYWNPTTLYSAAGTALPTCNASSKGQVAVVSDATSPTYNGTYTSGGAVTTTVVCSGTTWLTH